MLPALSHYTGLPSHGSNGGMRVYPFKNLLGQKFRMSYLSMFLLMCVVLRRWPNYSVLTWRNSTSLSPIVSTQISTTKAMSMNGYRDDTMHTFESQAWLQALILLREPSMLSHMSGGIWIMDRLIKEMK